MTLSNLAKGAAIVVAAVAACSFVHPWGNLRSGSPAGGAVLAGASVPDEVRGLFVQKCGDCHSNDTRWPLYSRVAPASWLVESDVHEGREHLNFSSWDQYKADDRVDLLAQIGTQVRQGKMPLKQYLLLHPDARLSDADRKLILDWTKNERKRLMAETAK